MAAIALRISCLLISELGITGVIVQCRLKHRRKSRYEAHCESLMKRQRRHEKIDKHMNEVRLKQHAAKMASDTDLHILC